LACAFSSCFRQQNDGDRQILSQLEKVKDSILITQDGKMNDIDNPDELEDETEDIDHNFKHFPTEDLGGRVCVVKVDDLSNPPSLPKTEKFCKKHKITIVYRKKVDT
jgi:hypothetical protein